MRKQGYIDRSARLKAKKGEGKMRTCLACGKPFPSSGPGNRRCPKCQAKMDGDRQFSAARLDRSSVCRGYVRIDHAAGTQR